jgi:hypothetical protein
MHYLPSIWASFQRRKAEFLVSNISPTSRLGGALIGRMHYPVAGDAMGRLVIYADARAIREIVGQARDTQLVALQKTHWK